MIKPIAYEYLDSWLAMRKQLWPDCTDSEHQAETKQFLSDSSKSAQFIYMGRDDEPLGFVEASIRHEYVNGASTSPVAYIDGIFVVERARQTGIAKNLFEAVSDWASGQNLSELISDVDLSNRLSQTVHRALGFEETERVVYFRKSLVNAP